MTIKDKYMGERTDRLLQKQNNKQNIQLGVVLLWFEVN